MRGSTRVLALLGTAAMLGAAALSSPVADAAPRAPLTHSHNDYERSRPLEDALAHRFDSVEADVWLVKGELVISHLGFRYRGNLKELYLDPLQRKVQQTGSVYGDGKPFYLWVDIKDGNPKLLEELHELLDQYPMLTSFTDSEIQQKPVTVILTGNEKQKTEYVERYLVRKACRDSTRFDITDSKADHRWMWYSLKWSDLFKWRGGKKIEPRDHAVLLATVNYIHEKGRRVRFWDAPETEDFWQLASEAQVDVLGTDHITRLVQFVQAFFLRGPNRSPASN